MRDGQKIKMLFFKPLNHPSNNPSLQFLSETKLSKFNYIGIKIPVNHCNKLKTNPLLTFTLILVISSDLNSVIVGDKT